MAKPKVDISIRARTLQDLFRQLDDGSLDEQQLRAFVDHRNPFSKCERTIGNGIPPLKEGDLIRIQLSADRFTWVVSFEDSAGSRISNGHGQVAWMLPYVRPSNAQETMLLAESLANLLAGLYGHDTHLASGDNNRVMYRYFVIGYRA